MHRLTLRVYYEDTDCGGVVYHANYLKFIERARSEIFFRADRLPEEAGGHFVVRRLQAEFYAPARLGESLEIETLPLRLRGAALTLLQRVFCGDRLLFEASVELAFIRQGRPVRMGRALTAFLESAFAEGSAKAPPHPTPRTDPPAEEPV